MQVQFHGLVREGEPAGCLVPSIGEGSRPLSNKPLRDISGSGDAFKLSVKSFQCSRKVYSGRLSFGNWFYQVHRLEYWVVLYACLLHSQLKARSCHNALSGLAFPWTFQWWPIAALLHYLGSIVLESENDSYNKALKNIFKTIKKGYSKLLIEGYLLPIRKARLFKLYGWYELDSLRQMILTRLSSAVWDLYGWSKLSVCATDVYKLRFPVSW